MRVEFIWDEECPNVTQARANLMRALSRADVPVRWKEWRRDDPDAPEYVKNFGSPTILVDGIDVDELSADADGNCCRIYTGADGTISGVPSVEAIVQRLQMALHQRPCSL